jgi:hypothetical protein
MTKQEALELIDYHKNKLIDPIEMLKWSWLRLLILKIDDNKWNDLMKDIEDTIF